MPKPTILKRRQPKQEMEYIYEIKGDEQCHFVTDLTGKNAYESLFNKMGKVEGEFHILQDWCEQPFGKFRVGEARINCEGKLHIIPLIWDWENLVDSFAPIIIKSQRSLLKSMTSDYYKNAIIH